MSENLTTVVNVKSGEEYDVYIGRENPSYGLKRSRFANPFKIGKSGTREKVLYKFEAMLRQERMRILSYRARYELKGKRLGCWCAPELCHGDILAEIAEMPRTAFEAWLDREFYITDALIMLREIEAANK